MAATGYTRQAAADFAAGLGIKSADFNSEYNQIQSAFDNTTGHDHSGSASGVGSKILLASSVSGTLPIANGGTGATTAAGAFTNIITGSLPIANGGTGQTATPVFQSTNPSPGGAISNAAQAMFGATATFTPTTTGKMRITISGSLSIAAGPQTATLQIRALSGSAPAYNAAASGTILATTQILPQNGAQPQSFSLTGIITLAASSAAWCDLSASISGGTSVSVANLTVIVDEKPI